MNKKFIMGAVAGAVIIAGAGFYAGDTYAKNNVPVRGGGAGQFAGRGGMRGAGFAAGTILSKDASSITIKMQNGSTNIVLVGASTAINKNAAGSAADLTVGTNVLINGSANSDGSITAQTIQIRPAMPPGQQPAQQ